MRQRMNGVALTGCLALSVLCASAEIVAFKDAKKIKSWDAWGDHKPRVAVTNLYQKERKCVTWEKIRKLDCGLEPAGRLEVRKAKDIAGSQWSIGCETMDRDYADWEAFKNYLPELGVKHARFFSGWAKTEQEKGVYDFAWLDKQLRECAAMGVKPWVCISYGNPVWGSDFRLGMRVKQVTGNPEAFEAWLRYTKALVARYGDIVDEWEIWNEPFNQAEEYAEMFYRTAKAVREVQPKAKCFCTAIAMKKDMAKSDYAVVLEKLKRENALDLGSYFIYHPYAPNPDTSYGDGDGQFTWQSAMPLRRLVKSYSPAFDIMQGEVGCPSQLEYGHALSNIEWTEYAQAKWNLRRTIGDAVRSIPSSVFTMVDLQYTFMLQSFGLLRCNLLKEVVYRRPSWYAMRHVFSYFDDNVHPVGVARQRVNGRELTVATFERQSVKFWVMWYSDRKPDDALAYERGDVEVDGQVPWGGLAWVDLLTGKIHLFPAANAERREGGRTFLKGVPLWDSPIMVAGNSQVPRRTDWRAMKPAEIVDALYRPNQQNNPWVRKIKMDCSKEPWAEMKTEDFLPCFDKYGQFKYRTWPGKTENDDQLKAAAEEEAKDLAAHPGPDGRSRFGGWTKGPKLEASGRFRTHRDETGRWWLVDPEGYLFWSWGPVRVTPSSALTPLNGNTRTPLCGGPMPDRDCLFEGLPRKGDPLAKFYDTADSLLLPFYLMRGETRRFDFSAANICRKYGADWFAKYSDICHRRLRSWGCNTIANSSDLDICLQDRTPYAERVEVKDGTVIAGSWGAWGKFRDPFASDFKTEVKKALETHGQEAHDPWCIGFFIDNEIQWGPKDTDLAQWTLWSPDDQPAKVEFVRRLKAKGIDPKVDAVPVEELRAFTLAIVEEYFKRTREAVKEFDSGLLYLGCRFAGGARPWTIGACVRYCDVVSYNIYAEEIGKWRLPQNLDAPVMIGEFHFGAWDRGLFCSGLINKGSQEGRAAALRKYVESALDNPQVVGAHWHQYSDQATSGRFDGEMLQVGWTDICDKPYPETVKELRALGATLYERRDGAGNANVKGRQN